MPDEEKELTLHPDRQGLRIMLGDLEAEIMDEVWHVPGGDWCTVRDIYEAMLTKRRIAYTTVMNTMTRLAKKGLLESTRQDQPYLYRPRQSRQAFIDSIIGRVVERLLVQFEGPTQAALDTFDQVHPDAAGRAIDIVEEIKRRRALLGSGLSDEEYGGRV